MQNKIILTLLAALLLVSTALSYTASNSQLNITIYDSYNSYHKSSGNLNMTVQPNIQGYTSNGNLNMTFAQIEFFQIGPGGTSTSTSSTSTSTSSVATTSVSSSGGGSGSSNNIIIVNPPITEAIQEIIDAIKGAPGQDVVYQDVLSKKPYRLSIVLLTFLFIFLLTIRITKFIKLKKHTPQHHIKRRTHKSTAKKLKKAKR